ncbi:MAG TPA: hypothetical protein PKD85_01475, partial [Saprospiraceae bacterium]|nr:hypothetical protein [Saprospiraceae bacterium]
NSLKNVKFILNRYTVSFSVAQLNTNIGIPFNRVTGPQTFIMRYENGIVPTPTWEFSIRGGSNATSGDGLPIYANTATNYGVNDYVPDNSAPKGCTISVLPKPTNTTRINIFEIVENVTGLNLTFQLSMSPFAPVPPLLTFPAPQVALFGISMTTLFYRTVPGFTTSGLPSSFGAPDYNIELFDTPFISGGVNPLDAGIALPFRRFSRQQTITVRNTTTGFYFAFEIDYGIINQGNGYIGYISPTINALLVPDAVPQNCTITNTGLQQPGIVKVLEYTVVALDGRTYVFTFNPNPYTQTNPTIRLVGPVLGAESVVVESTYLQFRSI